MSAPGHRSPTYALVGNPNCGKSTLFNALTGLKQKVGNYPGVTVERKVGTAYTQHGQPLTLIDLPGTYSLAARSPDEAVTRDVLLGRRADTPTPDRVVCVVDATNLERNLYLVHQVLDLGRPVVIVLNMSDLARAAGLDVRADALSRALGVPVIACAAASGQGVIELKLALSRADLPLPRHAWDVPVALAPAVAELQAALTRAGDRLPLVARAEALLLLTDADPVRVAGSTPLAPAAFDVLNKWRQTWAPTGLDPSAELVGARYEAIAGLTAIALGENANALPTSGRTTSDQIDAYATHPLWGWLILGTLLAGMFYAIFTLAEYPMNWIEGGLAVLSQWVRAQLAPGALRDLITDGAIAGVAGVLVFLPQILILFLFIGLLEGTGYMARAAFIMDRLMGRVGLNGKSFIPLLSSYACAIPGIMAARTIEDPKDRLVTILVAPFMSCSARLPVYLLLIAALVPSEVVPTGLKVGLMLLMYALGTLGAFGFAWFFRKTLLKSAPTPLILELPPYRAPRARDLGLALLERAGLFVKRAGTVILALLIVLWALAAYPRHANPEASGTEQLSQSYVGRLGHALEPAIRPLGFDWQIGIGLVSSFAAREVFVSTMAVVFSAESDDEEDTTRLREAIRAARWSDGRTLFTPLVCLNLMVFYVFAMQCISTIAVVKRETASWRWPLFQTAYMTGFAWLVCFVIYQVGTALGH
jgi:ferrous iron transport protein B